MDKKKRPIFILDGRWIRPKQIRLDMDVACTFPAAIGDLKFWSRQQEDRHAVDLSYVKRDGITHAVQVYTTTQGYRPSGREMVSFSTQSTDDQPLFIIKRTVTQEEYDAMHSDVDDMEWSI